MFEKAGFAHIINNNNVNIHLGIVRFSTESLTLKPTALAQWFTCLPQGLFSQALWSSDENFSSCFLFGPVAFWLICNLLYSFYHVWLCKAVVESPVRICEYFAPSSWKQFQVHLSRSQFPVSHIWTARCEHYDWQRLKTFWETKQTICLNHLGHIFQGTV